VVQGVGKLNGVWRSPVARLLWEQEVPGSNPGAPILEETAPSTVMAGGALLSAGVFGR
jgi:hypothetical protein